MKSPLILMISLRNLFFSVLIFSLFLLSSCFHNYYKITEKETPSITDLKAMQSANKFLVLHNNNLLWNVSNVNIENGFVSGIAYKIYPERYNFINLNTREPYRYRRRENLNQSYIINEIHFYVDEPLAVRDSVKIPVELIRKIEIYDKNKSATTGSYLIGSLGVAIPAFIIVAGIVLSSSDFLDFNTTPKNR